MWYEFLALLSLASVLFYRYMTKYHDHFKKRGIPFKKPVFVLGSLWEVVIKKKNIIDIVKNIYEEHDGQ